MEEKDKSRIKQEDKLLTRSIKTLPGILYYIVAIALAIAFIGCLLDSFCYYNPTILSELNQNINFMQLDNWYLVFIFIILAPCGFLGIRTLIWTGFWKNKFYLVVLLSILVVVFCIISHIVLEISIASYIVEEFPNLSISYGAGYYMFVIGLYAFAILNIAYMFILNQILHGKIKIDGINSEK